MSTELTVQRDHLRQHRGMIIARSLAASLVGAVPVPIIDDRLTFLVLRSMLRKVARDYQVDLSETAAEGVIYGKAEPPNWAKMAGGTLAYRVLSKTWRKLIITYYTAKRAQAAARYFTRGTLFDHYCAKLHVGLGLDGPSALALREIMNQAMDETPGSLGSGLFRRAAKAATRASIKAPVELIHLASGGALRKLLSRNESDEVEAIEELELALEQQLRAQSSFIARATTAVELQLSVEVNPYLEQLVDNFERLWRHHCEALGQPGG